jgi:hypothetical protein
MGSTPGGDGRTPWDAEPSTRGLRLSALEGVLRRANQYSFHITSIIGSFMIGAPSLGIDVSWVVIGLLERGFAVGRILTLVGGRREAGSQPNRSRSREESVIDEIPFWVVAARVGSASRGEVHALGTRKVLIGP